jgi:ribosomal-protein-alanine N-acetyltransferase
LSLRITLFRPRHLPRLLALEREVFPADAYPRELFLELHAGCGALFFVAHAEGSVAGYIVTCASRRKAELVSIAVDPRYRGRGIGGALVERTIAKLRAAGVRRLELAVRVGNRDAIAFYRRRGFERLERLPAYYENGGDAYRMRLSLGDLHEPARPANAHDRRARK